MEYAPLVSFITAHAGMFAIGLIASITLIFSVFLSIRIDRLTRGGNGKTLEGTIARLTERATALEAHAKETTLILKEADERLMRSIQGVAVKRFDPFQNAGGQQSFATALLSEEGNGIVISGIHARDNVRVYAKEVKNFNSERELSEEERAAIAEAKKVVE